MKNEPKRHHYIPQFVLKQFCYKGNDLWFYDIDTESVSSRETREVFMERYLYRDDSNEEDFLEIERDFAVYETEISKILSKQFYNEKKIYITHEESESIKLFYALMGFRSKRTSDYFKNAKDERFKEFYSQYQMDDNYDALWKRNLKEIVKCRSIEEVFNNPHIDEPIKRFMFRDTGFDGSYLKVVETEREEFILSDSYPVVLYATISIGPIPQLDMFELFPISPTRAILLIFGYADRLVDNNNSFVPMGFFTRPMEKNNQFELYTKKMKDDLVAELNTTTRNSAEIGLIARNKSSFEKVI